MKTVLATCVVVALLVGCNNKEPKVESSNEQSKQVSVSSTEQVTKKTDANTKYPFTHFSLDAEYENDISYEVEYEHEKDRVTAEIEDEVNQVFLKGDDAYTQLSKQLELLTINENSTDDEVLEQVIDVFKLNENYKHIEVEVRFNDGKEKEYNFRK